mmetsp:Transcript_19321/g.48918  ORF Transcript_19321/g.48918 Transcript_19321/m.48918 type:complete len:88 (-) Transcript_19321:53-316(-)
MQGTYAPTELAQGKVKTVQTWHNRTEWCSLVLLRSSTEGRLQLQSAIAPNTGRNLNLKGSRKPHRLRELETMRGRMFKVPTVGQFQQ